MGRVSFGPMPGESDEHYRQRCDDYTTAVKKAEKQSEEMYAKWAKEAQKRHEERLQREAEEKAKEKAAMALFYFFCGVAILGATFGLFAKWH